MVRMAGFECRWANWRTSPKSPNVSANYAAKAVSGDRSGLFLATHFLDKSTRTHLKEWTINRGSNGPSSMGKWVQINLSIASRSVYIVIKLYEKPASRMQKSTVICDGWVIVYYCFKQRQKVTGLVAVVSSREKNRWQGKQFAKHSLPLRRHGPFFQQQHCRIAMEWSYWSLFNFKSIRGSK